jgi:WD40 repeat protein
LWDPDTGQQVGELVVEKGVLGLLDFGTDRPNVAAYSPDGRRIAVGFLNDLIGVWDAASGKPLHLFRRHGMLVYTLAFSPDGQRLAVAGGKNFILLYDLETGRELRRLEGHEHTSVNTVQFSKDGARLVSAAADRTARVWDIATGKELAVFKGHTEAVRAAVFHGDADTVVTAGDQTVRSWSVPPPAPVPTLLTGGPPPGALARLFGGSLPRGHTSHVTALAFSPDGQAIVTGDQDCNVRLWDARTGRLTGGITEKLRGEVRHASFTSDGKTVYLGTDLNRVTPGERGDKDTLLSMVHRWDPSTGQAARFLKGQAAGVFHMALSPDGRRVLLVNTSSGLAFRPTKTDPLFYGWDDAKLGVTVWDTATGQLLSRLPVDPAVTGRPPPLFFPDGKAVLLATSQGNELAVYDAATGSRVRALATPADSHSANWSGMAVSPDGRTIAAQRQGGHHVWFWDAATGAVLGSHQIADATSSWVPILRFSPDSKRLAVTADRLVLILDVATRGRTQLLRGHEAEVKAVAFSPDGSRLLTGSDDRSAILWDAAAGHIIAVYKGHPGPVSLVAYSPDGQRVATASTDPLARVWPVDLFPEFEKRRPRELTPQERGRYELPAR